MGKNIIISRTDSIGDVVLTVPMAGFLKKRFPDCKIYFLGKSYTQPVIAKSSFIDTFINWDEIQGQSTDEQVDFFSSLNADSIIHVFPNKQVAKIAKKAGIKERIGTSHRLFHIYTCNKRVNFSRRKSNLHEAQLNLKLLSPFGINLIPSFDEITECYGFNKPAEANSVIHLLKDDKFNLIIHPKSKGSAVEWGMKNFQELMKILPEDGFEIFITGTKEEGKLVSTYIPKQSNIHDVTGKMSLSELINFIASADGLLAASTGPLHLAASNGINAIGLYSTAKPIHPGRWQPIGRKAQVIVLNESELPGIEKSDRSDLSKITPNMVKERLIQILSSKKEETV